jgi:uncharacterized membrane protein
MLVASRASSDARGTIRSVSDRVDAQKDLPTLERGRDLSRVLAFTDGVFAIAITLLVLQLEVPADLNTASAVREGLLDQLPDLTAYAISFVVIGRFWISNHRFMRTVREFDSGLMWLLLLYLGIMVLIPFTSETIGQYGDYPIATILYTLNMVALSFAAGLMMHHASRRGLARPEYEWDVDLSYRSSLFTTAVFALSLPLVFVVGPWAPLSWFVLRLDPYERSRNRRYKTN